MPTDPPPVVLIAEWLPPIALVPPAAVDLAAIVEATGDTRTDIINRAIQLYRTFHAD